MDSPDGRLQRRIDLFFAHVLDLIGAPAAAVVIGIDVYWIVGACESTRVHSRSFVILRAAGDAFEAVGLIAAIVQLIDFTPFAIFEKSYYEMSLTKWFLELWCEKYRHSIGSLISPYSLARS